MARKTRYAPSNRTDQQILAEHAQFYKQRPRPWRTWSGSQKRKKKAEYVREQVQFRERLRFFATCWKEAGGQFRDLAEKMDKVRNAVQKLALRRFVNECIKARRPAGTPVEGVNVELVHVKGMEAP